MDGIRGDALRLPDSSLSYPEDSYCHTLLSCIPVICIIMQQWNRRWVAEQEANLDRSSPQYIECKKNLLEKAIKYEKEAFAGQVIPIFAVAIILMLPETLVPFIPLVALAGVAWISFKIGEKTAIHHDKLKKDLRLLYESPP